MTTLQSTSQDARRKKTMAWVLALCSTGMMFDGYDLVVYGTVVSTFLRNPAELGVVTPALAGTLGSYALIGVLVGALLSGTVGDFIGRRKVMLTSYVWFSIAMALTALVHDTNTFGLLRFLTGVGAGAFGATAGAMVSEFAPPGKKHLFTALTYIGVPLGSLMSALVAILFLESIGWRGMFWVGALPLVTLVPLAFLKLPESPAWLVSRGQIEKARQVCERTGIPMPIAPVKARTTTEASTRDRAGFAGLFTSGNALPAILLGFTSIASLLLVYALNTWLPELMRRAGYSTSGSLAFLLVLNGGAVVGALFGSRLADRFGPKLVVASCFLLGAVSLALLTLELPLGVLLVFVAFAGLGTNGTTVLLFGLVANYFRTNVRAAAMAWGTGFGRLGGVGGPLLGGVLISAGLALNAIFFVLAAVALVGMVLILLLPRRSQAVADEAQAEAEAEALALRSAKVAAR